MTTDWHSDEYDGEELFDPVSHCKDCDRPTASDHCQQCGAPLCPMCYECGAGFCNKHPDENFEPPA